jgi:hypothetical protein
MLHKRDSQEEKRARCREAARGSTVKHTVELWCLGESSHCMVSETSPSQVI